MVLSDTSFQMPTTDDIDQDSLEYLFGRRRMPTPWVKMAREPEPVARISPEMVRLQAKAETIAAQLDSVLNQLNRAHVDLGFAKAQLADKNEQLKLFFEYRARAAYVVAAETERVILNERIGDLQMQLQEALEQNRLLTDTVAAYTSLKLTEAMAVQLFRQAPAHPLPAEPIQSDPPAPITPPPVILSWLDAAAPVGVADAIMRHAQEETFILSVGLEAVIFALMICFAGLVILHILV